MMKTRLTQLTVFAAAMCTISPSIAHAQFNVAPAKHYRLTFVLTYPEGTQPSQTFVVDVPVSRDRAGMATSSMASGLTAEPNSVIQENLQCTDVQESATGLAAKVAFSMDSIGQPLPNSSEPLHHNLTFNRQIDVELGKTTRITDEMHARPLKPGDEAYTKTLPPAPQITVMAVAL